MIQTDLNSFSYKKGSLLPWCKRCGTENFYRDGKNKKGFQRYKCKKCGFRFVWTSDLPRRNFFSEIMSFAVEMYISTGISLRTLAKKILKFFKIKISHEGIRQWILAAKNDIPRRENKVYETVWHADETRFKIKGKPYWLWIVYGANTKEVLSWHVSDIHLIKHAKKVMDDALFINGQRPEKIITDGLWQYPIGIYKAMGWNKKEHKKRHIIDSGIGKNALIERLNREIKRRVKWFSTFQALTGAKAFFGLWFYHHNTQYLT